MASITSIPPVPTEENREPVPALNHRRLLAVSAAVGAVLLALSGRHGYHVDELYNRVTGEHLAWGYVDQPPLVALIARLEITILGDSLTALRVVPALLTCLVVWTAGLIARELGGGSGAQVLAAAATGASLVTLNAGHVLTTNVVDLVTWVVLSWLVIRLLRTRDTRLWVATGAITGVGLLAKNLIVLLVLALFAGVLTAGPRAVLRSRHLAAGALLGGLIGAPALLWQAGHGWPALEMSAALKIALGADSRLAFVPFQLLLVGVLLAPVWITGLVALLRRAAWRPYRGVGSAYLFMVVLLLAIGGKPEYTGGLLLVLLAAGCVVVAEWARTGARRGLIGAAVAGNAVMSAVLMLPVLPVAVYGTHPALTGLGVFQLDQAGWPQLAEQVAAVHRALPGPDRARAVVYANHYGLAGALDRYGPENGLPPVYSGQNSYADFGRPADDTNVVIAVGVDPETFGALFTSCTPAGRFETGLPLADQHTAFLVCREPRDSWDRLWTRLTWIGFQCPYTSEAITARSEHGCWG
jgi:hypothetical protein